MKAVRRKSVITTTRAGKKPDTVEYNIGLVIGKVIRRQVRLRRSHLPTRGQVLFVSRKPPLRQSRGIMGTAVPRATERRTERVFLPAGNSYAAYRNSRAAARQVGLTMRCPAGGNLRAESM
jgi:hypothetical protein